MFLRAFYVARLGLGLAKVFPVNEECLVLADHQSVGIESLPFVHTARRYYRLSVPVRVLE